MRAPLRPAASAKTAQPLSRRNDVRADVAQRLDPPIRPDDRREAAEPSPRDVLEEDALDRLLGAEREHLVERRRDGFGHGRIIPPR